MKTIHAAAALAVALFVAPVAAQDSPAGARAQAVAHGDLDLRDARDVARFDRRIVHAARALCGEASAFDMIGRRTVRDCAEAAVSRVADARAGAIADARATMVAGR